MRKTLSDAGAPVRIAADVDWTLAYFPNIHNGDAGRALAELDMVGWSLYRPFIGVTQGFVKWEQKEHVKDLRRWMDGHSLKGKPLAIFEFGVTQRLLPSDWNKNHFSKADQRNAYLSWIDLLQTPGGSDVVGPFTFWFGMDDPRTSLSNDEISRGYAEPN
jgi:hypothetical protein